MFLEQSNKSLSFNSVSFCNEIITYVSNALHFGVYLDKELTMTAHVTAIVKSVFYLIRRLRSVWKYIETLGNPLCNVLSSSNWTTDIAYYMKFHKHLLKKSCRRIRTRQQM